MPVNHKMIDKERIEDLGYLDVERSREKFLTNKFNKSKSTSTVDFCNNAFLSFDRFVFSKFGKYSTAAKKRYFDALTLDPTASHATIKRMANHFKEKQNIRIKLTKQQAKFFSKAATEISTEPNELATKIVS